MNSLTLDMLPGTRVDPRYPDSDGRFMGETEYHNVAMSWLRDGLEDHFADRPDVYVASNIVFYYKRGQPKNRKDPDVLVAKGTVGKHRRRSYRLWEEKVLPCTLFEVASKRTSRNDIDEKRRLYAKIGIKEYFIFDAEGGYLKPRLQGFRSVNGKSIPMKPAADGSLVSKELGLRLVPEGTMLRLIDLHTGEPILTRRERIEQEEQRAEQEKQRAEQERQRAEQEKQRADHLSSEVQRLREELAKRKNGKNGQRGPDGKS